MKKIKYFLALILVVIMSVLPLGGCSNKSSQDSIPQEDNEGKSSEDDLYIIDVLVENATVESSLDTTVGQYIADKFGIGFNFVVYSGDIQEKQALMLAGGDYNEIQYMQFQNMVQQYIDAGALLNLDDYKEILPDFYKRYEEKLIPYWRTAASDGGLYKWETTTPRDLDTLLPHFDIMVRTDVLEYYGWPELVSASDWIEFLKKAVEDFPTTYDGQATVGITAPMAESWGLAGLVAAGYEKGDTYVEVGNDYFIWNTKTESFEEYLLTPDTKESFEFFNALYTEGLLDEECFTDTSDITGQKMCNGSAIAVWYINWNNKMANQALTDAGHPEMSYIEMPFQLDSQIGGAYTTPAFYSYPYMSFGITKNCKDPERVLKFINWCCTEEGQLLLQSGIEGIHYTVENGMRVPTELRKQCSTDPEIAKKEGIPDSGLTNMPCLPMCYTLAADGQPYNLADGQEYIDEFSLTDRQKEAYKALGWETSNQWWAEHFQAVDVGYGNSCALDTASDLGKIGAKMVELRIKYSANLIMAEDFNAVWEELMTEYNKLDHEAVIAAMNETLAEYKNNLN